MNHTQPTRRRKGRAGNDESPRENATRIKPRGGHGQTRPWISRLSLTWASLSLACCRGFLVGARECLSSRSLKLRKTKVAVACAAGLLLAFGGRWVWQCVCAEGFSSACHWRQQHHRHHEDISYPLVTPRNSRTQVSAYSRFLEVTLARLKQQSTRTADDGRSEAVLADTTVDEFSGSPRSKASDVLRLEQCLPGWICRQCLVLSQKHSNCQMVCPACYFELLCSRIYKSEYLKSTKEDRDMERVPQRKKNKATNQLGQNGIPRVVHQSGPKDWLDPSRFPQLVRVQNSWRAQQQQQQHISRSGSVTYRYHTPETADRFVHKHFPSLHGMYDAMPESRQRILFSWLMLYQVGGVFASIEMLLEASLDAAVFDTNSSFVSSTVSAEDGGCCLFLWDDFLATRPRHPILALAINLYLELVSTETLGGSQIKSAMVLWEGAENSCRRVDGDAQQSTAVCWSYSEIGQNLEAYVLGKAFRDVVWSNRRQTPCDDDVGLFGSHVTPSSGEKSVLLLRSPDDTGATRLTNIDQNLLVASTDILGLSLEPLGRPGQGLRQSSGQ